MSSATGPGAAVWAAALRLLARAARSTAELEEALAARGFATDVVAAALARLCELRYLDDEDLALRRAEDLLLRRGCGRLRVAHELTRRGVADTVIEKAIAAALEGRSERELAREALGRKLGGRPLVSPAARQRAFRFLTSRGHPPETVEEILETESSSSSSS